jgi:hypothetical protein
MNFRIIGALFRNLAITAGKSHGADGGPSIVEVLGITLSHITHHRL